MTTVEDEWRTLIDASRESGIPTEDLIAAYRAGELHLVPSPLHMCGGYLVRRSEIARWIKSTPPTESRPPGDAP